MKLRINTKLVYEAISWSLTISGVLILLYVIPLWNVPLTEFERLALGLLTLIYAQGFRTLMSHQEVEQ